MSNYRAHKERSFCWDLKAVIQKKIVPSLKGASNRFTEGEETKYSFCMIVGVWGGLMDTFATIFSVLSKVQLI